MPTRPARWPRAQRLDAQRMIATIQAETGLRLRFDGPCRGGQVGAAYVLWPDGHRSVLTWRPGIDLAQLREGPLAVIEALRAIGYPAPAAELTVADGGAVAQVWELMPRPSPVPPYLRLVLASACWKASKMMRCLSSAMPMPESVTSKATTDA